MFRPFVTFAAAFELAPGRPANYSVAPINSEQVGVKAEDSVVHIGRLNLYRPPVTNAVFTGAGTTYKEGVDWKPGFNLAGTVDGVGGTGRFYTLGEMVLTGGRFYGEINLKVQ